MTAIDESEALEITYMTGIAADGTIAATSFWTWNDDTPATYGNDQYEAKWGDTTAGTPGTISYKFDPASQWTATEENAFRATMQLWSDVANVTFVESTNVNTRSGLTISRGSDGGASGGVSYYYPGTTGSTTLGQAGAATISIDTSVAGFGPLGASLSDYGGYPWTTLIHEEGHVLGLGHSGAYNEGTTTTSPQLTSYDTRQYSVMSYNDPSDVYWGDSRGDNGEYYSNTPTTWMPLDILAAQRIYGVATNSPLSGGGQVFGFHSNIAGSSARFFNFTINSQPIVTLWDGGTNNTLDLSGFSAPSTVDLHDGAFSSAAGLSGNIAIAYGTRIDTIITGAGNDTITANDDGDTITGGAGQDMIMAGAGSDTFRDTVSDFNGDAIYGFGSNDRVAVTDTSIGSFSFTRDAPGLLLNGTAQILLGGANVGTHFSEIADPAGGVDIFVSAHDPALQDFTGDGHSDMIWRNADGTFTTWDIQANLTGGKEQENTYSNGGVDQSWVLQGTFDWNGDGYADLLWRNTNSGHFTIWTGDGSGGFNQNYVTDDTVSPAWTLAAIGDFNGDGKDDLLWRNANGNFTVWDTQGVPNLGSADGFAENVYQNSSVGLDWKIQAVGDFNGDGRSDILWRNDLSGVFTIWSGGNDLGYVASSFVPNTYVNSTVGLDWHLDGVGDFNGDGKVDLLWRNDNGTFTIWTATGNGFAGNTYLNTTVGNDWHLAQIGDFNGDGKSDLLWRNDNGSFTIWDSNGHGFDQNAVVDGSVSTAWTVQTHHYDIV